MAKKGGERRMLFDTRGKRRNVIRVVYAILALLMGGSLFLVVGPFNLTELLGGSNGGNAADVFEEQAERIERRLAANPEDEQQLLNLTRARINAGNAQREGGSETEAPTVTVAARREFDAAEEAWRRYLKAADGEPSASGAQLVAGTFFGLAEASTTLQEADEYIASAAKAQTIAAEQDPNLGTLSTLAIYQLYNGEFKAAERTERRAKSTVPKQQAKTVEQQLAQYRKSAKEYNKQRKELAKVQSQANKEQLQNPLGLGATTPGQ